MIGNLISRRSPSAVASATAGSRTAPTPTPVKTSQTYYHRNQQYSIVGLTNAAGTLVERYTYSAYGTLGIYAANGTVRSSSTYANRYTYTGREWDADLRLYHFRARWYDPATGGFVSRDPLGYVDGMSLYRGYFAQPGTDPSGLLSIREIGIIGIAVAIQSLVCKRLEDDAIANHRARTPTIQESKCFNDAFKTMPGLIANCPICPLLIVDRFVGWLAMGIIPVRR